MSKSKAAPKDKPASKSKAAPKTSKPRKRVVESEEDSD